jgi:anti-sigma regulatory factor (Ser/Thr protein kinase)
MSGETIRLGSALAVTVPPRTAAEARERVEALLHECFCSPHEALGDDIVIADALLVTSELVTNAVRHAGGLTGFEAEVTESGLRLSVEDADDGLPELREPLTVDRPRCCGHGWRLVQRLAARVDIRPQPSGGKRITVLVPLL